MVTAPERAAVLDHASLYLEYVGFSGMAVLDVMEALEIAAVTRLTEIIDKSGIAQLHSALVDETEVDDLRSLQNALGTEIARLTGNPVLELFVRIGYNLGRTHGVQPTAAQQRWLHDRNVELVEAIAAGDVLSATRIVRRKLLSLRQQPSVLSDRTGPSRQDGGRRDAGRRSLQ